MRTPEPLTLPLACPSCGGKMTVEYIAKPDGRASCQCPYTGCRKIAKIGGVERVISVTARVSETA